MLFCLIYDKKSYYDSRFFTLTPHRMILLSHVEAGSRSTDCGMDAVIIGALTPSHIMKLYDVSWFCIYKMPENCSLMSLYAQGFKLITAGMMLPVTRIKPRGISFQTGFGS